MRDPWEIYDQLIDAIPNGVTVVAAATGPKWSRVASSIGSVGMALALQGDTRPSVMPELDYREASLRELAELSKSWNLAEASVGLAAINCWYSKPEVAHGSGFGRCPANTWREVFDPYADEVAGKVVSVIGHFPFAPDCMSKASELHMLERHPQPGDYPDSACEYLLPQSDYVFISGSAFVNKTMPRLLELAEASTTVVLGPSTPLSVQLFDYGVDIITGFVATEPVELFNCLELGMPPQMYRHAYRVEQAV